MRRAVTNEWDSFKAAISWIGTKLGAAYVLEGSVRRSNERVRVTAQLIDSQSGADRWSETYDRPAGDALKVQDDIATGLARALQVSVGADREQSRRGPISDEAYDLYLRGRIASDKGDIEGMVTSLAYLHQALDIDPRFIDAAEALATNFYPQSLAYAPLSANTYFFLSWVELRAGKWDEAEAAARKAVDIAPAIVWGHAQLSFALLMRGENALIGGGADREAFQVASVYGYRGERDEALKWLDRAFEQRDPNLFFVKSNPFLKNLERDPAIRRSGAK